MRYVNVVLTKSNVTQNQANLRLYTASCIQVLLMEDADPNMEIEVREIPYATRAITTTVGRAIKKEDSIALEEKAAAALAEAERKAKKLEEMRKKLEAFQQKIRRNK